MNAWGIVLAVVGFIIVYRVFVSPPSTGTSTPGSGAASASTSASTGKPTGTFTDASGTAVGGVSHPGQVAA
jgi:hypothetical protein